MFRKNSKDNGHYHSNWLSMMYPRLYLARNLLKEDGVIFVSIDDNEVHNLRLIMNEIFGEENFVTSLVWKKRVSPANDSKWFSSDHEYLIVYAKNKELWYPNKVVRTEEHNSYYKNPDNDTRGPWNSAAYTCNKSKEERPNLYYSIINPNTGIEIWPRETAVWAYSKEMHEQHVKDNLIWWGNDGKSKSPRKKQFLTEAENIVPRSFIDFKDGGSTQKATLDFLDLFDYNYFQYPKPVQLLKKILHYGTDKDNCELVMDFFAGSGTFGQAVIEQNWEDGGNRKFILVQLPEKTEESSEAYKAGYKTIADICRDRVIKSAKNKKEIRDIKLELEEGTQLGLDIGNNTVGWSARKGGKVKNIGVKIVNDNNEKSYEHKEGFKSYKLASSNFKIWRNDAIDKPEDLNKMIDLFDNKVKNGTETENILYELLLKSGYSLTEKVEKVNNFYKIASGETIIVVEKIDNNTAEAILEAKPKNVIILDKIFAGNDQLKTNLVLQMKDANIKLTTV